MAELHDLTALEQGAALRRGEVSAAELVEHYRGRADRLDREVGAYISRTDAVAERQARAVADRLAAADPAESLGPLFGTVVPVKDLNAFAGVRMTLGSAAVELVPTADDDVAARMRAGGLVMPGKTNTPEFGLPCYTENAVAPPARTPWDPTRSAGGSSGGAAAAVAAGMVSAAQGSDGGGSIRIPASVTGLVGVKPSRGRVGNGPLPEAVGELAVQGVLARMVRDAAALLDVLIGDASRGELLTAAGRDPGRLRIGRYAVPVIADAVVDPAVLAGYERTAVVL
ncbi:MAG TPA: amidase, partial [Candidatus Nanopelagicales bacterium]|nr:amidase [Candidatus Nanopelagicales bacterium]